MTVYHHWPPISSLLSHAERAAFRRVPSPRCPKVEMSLLQADRVGGTIAVPVVMMDLRMPKSGDADDFLKLRGGPGYLAR